VPLARNDLVVQVDHEFVRGQVQPLTQGCSRCFDAPSPEAAWQATRELTERARLVDDSHFIVRVLECAQCSQRFLSIFSERIDWQGGEDPQHRCIVPITPEEAESLTLAGTNVSEASLAPLGHGRRWLEIDWPAGGAPTTTWSSGFIRIAPHD
jgi:hypothetical protein